MDQAGLYTAPNLAGPRPSPQRPPAPTAGVVAGGAAVAVTGTAPTGALPGGQGTPQDTPLLFSSAAGNAITVNDLANPAGWVTVLLTARKGGLTLATTNGLTFSLGDGSNNVSMQFTGTVDAVNAALDGLKFTPYRNFTGPASIKVSVSDPATPGAPPTGGGTVSVAVRPSPVMPQGPLPGTPGTPSGSPQSPFDPTPAPADWGPRPGASSPGLNGGTLTTAGGSTSGGTGPGDHPGRGALPAAAPASTGATGPAHPGGRGDGTPQPPGPPGAARRQARGEGRGSAAGGGEAQAARRPARRGRRRAGPAGDRGAAAAPRPPAAPAVLTGSSPMWHELDKMQESVTQAEERRFRVVAGTASFLSVGASVLYFAWVLRAGSLVTSLLSSMPAWQFVDPLPILDQGGLGDSGEGAEGEEDAGLEELVAGPVERPYRIRQ